MYHFLHQHKCVVFMMSPLIQILSWYGASLVSKWRYADLYTVIPDSASVELLLIYTGAKEPGIRSKDNRIGL